MPLWRQICFLNHVIRSLLIICRCFSFVLTQEEFAQSGTELLQLSWWTNGTQLLQIWDPTEVWVLLRWSLKTELRLLFPCLTLNVNCLHRTGAAWQDGFRQTVLRADAEVVLHSGRECRRFHCAAFICLNFILFIFYFICGAVTPEALNHFGVILLWHIVFSYWVQMSQASNFLHCDINSWNDGRNQECLFHNRHMDNGFWFYNLFL